MDVIGDSHNGDTLSTLSFSEKGKQPAMDRMALPDVAGINFLCVAS